ncbi:MAG: hypothetical protein HKN20_02030 [Gemmatimonadetes bacterium]|nr:hypothetical protein [Gemmatimonadota bacterium]
MLSTHFRAALHTLACGALILAHGSPAVAGNGLPGPRLDLVGIIARATVGPPPYALRMPIPPPPLEDSPALADGNHPSGLAFTDRGTNPGYRLYRPQIVPLTRSEAAMKGLGQATTVGWVLGALGNTAGLWDRNTWGYMAAGSALAGAILGSTTGYESKAGWSARIEWNLDENSREEPR